MANGNLYIYREREKLLTHLSKTCCKEVFYSFVFVGERENAYMYRKWKALVVNMAKGRAKDISNHLFNIRFEKYGMRVKPGNHLFIHPLVAVPSLTFLILFLNLFSFLFSFPFLIFYNLLFPFFFPISPPYFVSLLFFLFLLLFLPNYNNHDHYNVCSYRVLLIPTEHRPFTRPLPAVLLDGAGDGLLQGPVHE